MSQPKMYVNRYHIEGGFIERVRLTPPLLMNLAKHNSMSAAKVSEALENGERVYTSFSYYEKEVT